MAASSSGRRWWRTAGWRTDKWRAGAGVIAVSGLLWLAAGCGAGKTSASVAVEPAGSSAEAGVDSGEPAAGADLPDPEPDETEPSEPEPDDSCPDEGFRITVSGSNAAMGVRAAGITMVNCGEAAIEVNGYPVVRVLDDGQPVKVEVRHGSDQLEDPGPSLVVVAPGESVHAGMLWRHRVESANPDDIIDATAIAMSYSDDGPLQIVEPEYSIDLGTTRTLEVTAWR